VIGYVLSGGPAEDQPNRAQVAGTLLAAAVIVPPVMAWGWRRRQRQVVGTSSRAEVVAAADRLAEQTLATWLRQVEQRGIEAPAPVEVQWRWAEGVALARHILETSPRLATDPRPIPSVADDSLGTRQTLSSGLVTRLHDEVYARLHHGRLVLMGNPGAGKTGAMILLLLESLRHRDQVPEVARPGVPVPVWLTLGSWNPRLQGLRDWVVTTISRDHPYLQARDFGPDAVAQLFDSSRIALFMDGLDEMPDVVRAEALKRLSHEAAGHRVVITSRPKELSDTLKTGQQLHTPRSLTCNLLVLSGRLLLTRRPGRRKLRSLEGGCGSPSRRSRGRAGSDT
jgi:hypothetical protein